MSQPANEGQGVIDQGFGLMDQGQQQEPPQQQQQDEVKFNEAWNPLLEKIPTQFHNLIAPDLKQWDQNYNNSIQKVHSQYAAYKPFLEQQIDPNALNEAYMLRQALEQDPMKFVQALMEHYKLELPTEQGQEPPDETDDENLYDITQNPEFQRYRDITETMAQALITQNQQAQEAQEDAALDGFFESAKQRHGDYDEDWVAQHLYFNGVDNVNDQVMDQAIGAYREYVQGIVQNYRSPSQSAPVIMGGGGGLPSQQTPVGSMSGKERRALIVQTLMNQAQSGQ